MGGLVAGSAHYKLTIAVPTFNRAALLQATLSGLFSAIGCSRDVQILVSDNASPDNTERVCRQYDKELNFKYLRNSDNIGFDGNYLNCIDGADADYVWVVGDDDCVSAVAIEKVLRHIDELRPSMIVLNGASNKRCRIDRTVGMAVFEDFDSFFGEYGYHFTWITSTVLRKSSLRRLNREELSLSDGFVHLALQLKSFLEEGKFVIDFEPLIETTDNVSDYSQNIKKLALLFARSLCNIVDMHSAALSSKSASNFLLAHHRRFSMFGSGFFIRARAKNLISRDEFFDLLPYFKKVTLKWRLAVLIYGVPKPIFNVVASLKGASK